MQSLAQNFKHENFYWNIAFHWRLTCACVCVCVLAYGLAFTIAVFLNRSISRCPFSLLLLCEQFYCLMNEDALLVIQPYRDLSFLTAFRISLSLSLSHSGCIYLLWIQFEFCLSPLHCNLYIYNTLCTKVSCFHMVIPNQINYLTPIQYDAWIRNSIPNIRNIIPIVMIIFIIMAKYIYSVEHLHCVP